MAIEDFDRAIQNHQTCSIAYYNRALCYRQMQKYSEAIKDFSIVLLLADRLKFRVMLTCG